MTLTLLLTSSRGGFLAFLSVLAILTLSSVGRPAVTKNVGRLRRNALLSLLLVASLFAIVWPQLPVATRDRIASLTSIESDYNLDATNRTGRGSIWARAISATAERPIGYGVASFPMVDMLRGGRFKAAHNSYIQYAVELGVLGLFLFVRMYWLSWRGLQAARNTLLERAPNREDDEKLIHFRMLQAGLAGNAVAGFFLSMAYSSVVWIYFGLVMASLSVPPIKPSAAKSQN
jgi:O-antigen ligase